MDLPGPLQLGQPTALHLDDATGALVVADIEHGRVQLFPHREQQRAAAHGIARRSAGADADATERPPRLMRGRCVEYRRGGGFGFVVGDDGKRYFAHHSDYRSSPRRCPLWLSLAPDWGDRGVRAEAGREVGPAMRADHRQLGSHIRSASGGW